MAEDSGPQQGMTRSSIPDSLDELDELDAGNVSLDLSRAPSETDRFSGWAWTWNTLSFIFQVY